MVVGEVVTGRYVLEELVRAGGMSSVFKARDTLLERRVALKILHPHFTDDEQYVERFRREARAVASLSHPNIVTILDRGEDEGRQFLVFELVEGQTLADVLREEGRLPVRRALEIAIQVARGLAFAHEQGLVHRDVKPQNVILNGDGCAKVTDFGIARSLDVQGVTQSGAVLGTSNYIAPEQASGRPVDQTTDVYSLGVVLYELLTGEVPFPGESFVAVAMQHVSERPPSVLDVRPDAAARPVRLSGVGSWDPYGDHAEHNEDVSKATDGDLGTYWTTEHYDSFTKPGVGLVLAAPRAERVTRVTVRTDTPGFTARIEAGSSETGSFSAVSPLRMVGSSPTVPGR